jgi:hypothetical protein
MEDPKVTQQHIVDDIHRDNEKLEALLQYWTDLVLFIQDDDNYPESDKHRAYYELEDVQRKLERQYDIHLTCQFC